MAKLLNGRRDLRDLLERARGVEAGMN